MKGNAMTKKRNKQDATLINISALKKRVAKLECDYKKLLQWKKNLK